MNRGPVILVSVIYGWGWAIDGKPRFEPPPDFTVRLDGRIGEGWTGIVLDDDHEFAGRRVELRDRHKDWDGQVTVTVLPGSPATEPSTGYAHLRSRPDL